MINKIFTNIYKNINQMTSCYQSNNKNLSTEIIVAVINSSASIISKLLEKKEIPPKEAIRETLFAFHDNIKNIFLNKPAITIQDSITDNYIICLEDGKHVKSLKNYIKKKYNMTPQEYIERWGLPSSYPMVHEKFSNLRKNIAKKHKSSK